MSAASKDPTEPIRIAAGRYAGVDEGAACTQASFKVGKKAFLFCGPQGKRFKAMFKLDASRSEAELLATREPDRFDVGSGPWVTARFTADQPMPRKLWKKWLDESYALTVGPPSAGAARKTTKKTPKKKMARKKTATKKTAKRTGTKKKATKRRARAAD